MSELITVIIPCYNEQETIPYFLDAINKVYDSMKSKYDVDMEYLFVDDGSKDNTLKVLEEYSKKVILSLSADLSEVIAYVELCACC